MALTTPDNNTNVASNLISDNFATSIFSRTSSNTLVVNDTQAIIEEGPGDRRQEAMAAAVTQAGWMHTTSW